MPDLYRTDLMLAPAGTGAGDVERINRVLEAGGLRAALGPPVSGSGSVAVLPVTGADPLAIREQVGQARDRGEELPDLTPDFQYAVDTLAEHPRERQWYWASGGKHIGHGTVGWLSAPRYELGDPEPWQPTGSPPVIAVLDTGIAAHDWLPPPWQGVPFHIDATAECGWRPSVPVRSTTLDEPTGARTPTADGEASERVGGYFGHGTFIAGIIRRVAPAAQVLSLRVMDDDGGVGLTATAEALEFVANRDVDVVLMAFGLRPGVTGIDHGCVRTALRKLAGRGIPVVISAGNHGSDEPIYPAAFATDPDLSGTVTSVGASVSATRRAPYSNHGVWVRQWRNGTNVVSLMPLTAVETDGDGYAWWSGTSFAAATYAAELIRR